MANASIDFLSGLKLNEWYKLAIYLGSALIILSFVFVNNSNVSKYTDFGVESLILGVLVWTIDETIVNYGEIRQERISNQLSISKKEEMIDNARDIIAAINVLRWFGLFIWIYIIVNSLI
jgi:hypothetical protein